jgi:hypothetical protein
MWVKLAAMFTIPQNNHHFQKGCVKIPFPVMDGYGKHGIVLTT